MPLDEDVRQILAVLAPPGAPDLGDLSVEDARQAMAATAALSANPEPVAKVENRTISGPAGEIPVRIYTPEGEGPLPVLVFFHGGGWVLCGLDTHDGTARRLCNHAHCIVISVDYRLAPEHPFPAPLDDCYAATCWAAENAPALGGDPTRLAVGGDSAGGNLAAAVALMTRDRGGPVLAHQLMVYPVIDARCETQSFEDNKEGYFLSAQSMRWFWGHYLGDTGDGANPYASPIRAEDLSDLPPATVLTAEYDPLRDEGEAYAERLKAAGVECDLVRYDGVVHGFFGMHDVLPKAQRAVDRAAQNLRRAFGTTAAGKTP